MATLSDLRDNIEHDLARSDLTTYVTQAINKAIEHYSRYRFWFNETTGTLSTVDGTQSYATADGLPSDIAEIDVVTVHQTSTTRLDAVPRTYQWIRTNSTNTALEDVPSDYAFYASKLWLYPTPNAVYTVTISYKKTYSDLSADSDYNDFTTNAQDLIEARARWWLMTRKVMDYNGASIAKADEVDALKALMDRTVQLTSSGKVRATSF